MNYHQDRRYIHARQLEEAMLIAEDYLFHAESQYDEVHEFFQDYMRKSNPWSLAVVKYHNDNLAFLEDQVWKARIQWAKCRIAWLNAY